MAAAPGRPRARAPGERPSLFSPRPSPDEGFAALAAELARALFFSGDLERAQQHRRRGARGRRAALDAGHALPGAEHGRPDHRRAGPLGAGLRADRSGRSQIALENDRTAAALRAYNNLGDMLDRRDRAEEAIEVQSAGLVLARKVGARANEWRLLSELGFMFLWLGRHDEARAAFDGIPEQGRHFGAGFAGPINLAAIEGDVAEARRLLDVTDVGRGEDADEQDRIGYLVLEAMVSNAEGRYQQALEAALPSLESRLDATSKLGWEEALVAAHALGRTDVVRDIVSRIEHMAPGQLPPTLRAHGIRFRALLGDEPDQRFLSAAAAFREYGWVRQAAMVQTEHAEWLVAEGRAAEAAALLAEARPVFERLKIRPWLERCDALGIGEPVNA